MTRRLSARRRIGWRLKRTALGGLVAGSMVGVPTAYSLVPASTPRALTMTTQIDPPQDIAIVETDPADSTIGRAHDGLFYVDARMNGKTVRCLIDTGASTIVLSGAQAARLAVGRVDANGSVLTAGGRVSASQRHLDHVEVAGRRFEHVPAIVVKSGDTPCLLGQDLLARLDRLEIAGDELRLQ